MTRAFTYLTEKVNFSLYKNTLTIYPKPFKFHQSSFKSYTDLLNAMKAVIQLEQCQKAKMGNVILKFQKGLDGLGVRRFVHREDSDHSCYHKDDFKMEANHYHAQFDKMTVSLLDKILVEFEKNDLITANEHKGFIDAYNKANVLPSKAESDLLLVKEGEIILLPYYETVPSNTSQAELDASVLKPKAHEKRFKDQLDTFAKKVTKFQQAEKKDYSKYHSAFDSAKTMHETLEDLYTQYQQGQISNFTVSANAAIDKARVELKNHRGILKYIDDLMCSLSSLVDAFKPNRQVNTEYSFFKTDSIRQLDALAETVNEFTV